MTLLAPFDCGDRALGIGPPKSIRNLMLGRTVNCLQMVVNTRLSDNAVILMALQSFSPAS
jgi:hypothetical protein